MGVAVTTFRSATLMVSFTGTAGAAAPVRKAVSTASVMTDWVTSGRAPSWMAAWVVSGAAKSKPAITEAVLVSPPKVIPRILEKP